LIAGVIPGKVSHEAPIFHAGNETFVREK